MEKKLNSYTLSLFFGENRSFFSAFTPNASSPWPYKIKNQGDVFWKLEEICYKTIVLLFYVDIVFKNKCVRVLLKCVKLIVKK